jgi:hypothetical protein
MTDPKGKELTSIRASKATTAKINNIKRMLELALGREVTQEEVVNKAVDIAFGDQLERVQEVLQDLLDNSDNPPPPVQ